MAPKWPLLSLKRRDHQWLCKQNRAALWKISWFHISSLHRLLKQLILQTNSEILSLKTQQVGSKKSLTVSWTQGLETVAQSAQRARAWMKSLRWMSFTKWWVNSTAAIWNVTKVLQSDSSHKRIALLSTRLWCVACTPRITAYTIHRPQVSLTSLSPKVASLTTISLARTR